MDVFINCPNCSHKCSPLDKECPNCKFSFTRQPIVETPLTNKVLFDPLSHAKYTETRSASASTGATVGTSIFAGTISLIFGGGLGIIGLVICIVGPLLGNCIGIPLIVFGVIVAISGFLAGAAVIGREGLCPYCGQLNKVSSNISNTISNFRCSSCKEKIIVENYRFYQNYLKL
jgi:uncharacterized membrane protein